MRLRALAGAIALALAASGCSNPFGRYYEYEEQLYLKVDGSAAVVIDASVAALVALRGVTLDPAAGAPPHPDDVRRAFEAGGCRVASVGRPWTRSGRHFVQIQIQTDNVRTLSACAPLAWSTYAFDVAGDAIHYHQTVGAAAGGPGDAKWDGGELVAFKLHLPSRVADHNVKRLDGANGELERGNILTWEQRLTDRRAGRPVEIDATMGAQSILNRALWLFVGAFLAAVFALAAIVWWIIRKGRARASRKA